MNDMQLVPNHLSRALTLLTALAVVGCGGHDDEPELVERMMVEPVPIDITSTGGLASESSSDGWGTGESTSAHTGYVTGWSTWGETDDPSTGQVPVGDSGGMGEGDSGGVGDTGDTGAHATGADDGETDDGGGACPTKFVRAPRATSTAHIEPFNGLVAANALLEQEPWKTLHTQLGATYAAALRGLIIGLAASANPTPPASFNNLAYGNKWGPWKASQEYRGYLDEFPFRIHCDVASNTLEKRPGTIGTSVFDYADGASLQVSQGFTRLPGPVFQNAEPHGTTPLINTLKFGDRGGGRTNQCITHRGYYASRVGAAERQAAFVILGYDAPFIWEDLTSTVCCDDQFEVNLRATHFPTHSLYLNFDRVFITWQMNLAMFLISGGTTLNPVGVGLMAGAGPNRNRTGDARVIDACTGALLQEYDPTPSVGGLP